MKDLSAIALPIIPMSSLLLDRRDEMAGSSKPSIGSPRERIFKSTRCAASSNAAPCQLSAASDNKEISVGERTPKSI